MSAQRCQHANITIPKMFSSVYTRSGHKATKENSFEHKPTHSNHDAQVSVDIALNIIFIYTY